MSKPWWYDHKFEDKDAEEARMTIRILEDNIRQGQKTLIEDRKYFKENGTDA